MKFSCYKNDLNEALQFVIRAVAVKPQTPVLSGIYLKAEGSVLELQANNYSTGIIARIPVNAEVSGEIVVGGKRLQEFVRNMPDDMITFFDEDNTLVLESGGASVKLLTMAAGEFPKVKTPEAETSFRIRAAVLRELIRKTVFAASKEESRPIFTGCCFEIKENIISLVATNTHRLALVKEELPMTYNEYAFVVPAETLRGLMARIDPKDVDNYVTINYSRRFLAFTFDNVFVTARLIDGTFPPYDRVIPTSSTTRAKVDNKDFREAVELVALMSKETEYNTVKLRFDEEGIEISSDSPEVGGAVKNIEAEVEGDGLEISFNAAYISDVLKVIDSPKVNVALNDRYSPAAFTDPDNSNYIYIATPVRT